MSVRLIHGPVISCGSLAAQRALFEKVYGMKPVAEQDLDRAAVQALWGVDGHAARTVLLETPGTHFGVRLIQFDPLSAIVIRDRSTGYDCDALKVIDFYAPDIAAAVAHIEGAGFKLKHEVAVYDMPEGRIFEGHLWGPDEVVTALISGPKDFFSQVATVVDRTFSEVQSISGPVADTGPVLAFYDQVLGLGVIHEYAIDDDSFAGLVGTPHKLKLRAKNIGLKRTEPYFGIIHYGLPPGAYKSLRDRSVMPNRGLVAATLFVAHIEDHENRAIEFGAEVLAPVAEVKLSPYGVVKSLTLRAPHGVIHHLIET
ncbi:MAG: hypothetical protein SFV21_21585 [Rhodospirillaceae bacterium]|nr:hypothetical protein [Rhodospirillaceae bacterium]